MASPRQLEDDAPPRGRPSAPSRGRSSAPLRRAPLARSSATCAASARRRCRSCCAWTRCAASRAIVLAAGARLRRRLRGDLHRADAQGGAARRRWAVGTPSTRPRHYVAVRLPRHRAAVRALGPVRRPRRAPGPARASSPSLFQVDGRRAALRGRQRRAVLELLHLLRLAVLRDRLSSARCAGRYEQRHRRAAARRRLPPPRGARRLRPAHRGRRARAAPTTVHAPIDVVGFISLHAAARQRPALARAARGPRRRCSTPPRRRGDHRRPRLPAGARRSSSSTQCHQRGVARAHRAVDDGDPRPPRRVRARASRCRCSSCARRCSRASTTSLKRTFDFVGSVAAADRCCSPLLLADRARGQAHLARPGALPLDAPGHRRRAVRVLQVPHDVRATPTSARPTSRRSTRPTARCSRSATTRASRRSGASCAASRSTSCRSCSTSLRGEMSLVGPRPLPAARLRPARGLAPQALPRAARASPACGRSPGRSELDFDDLVRLDFLYLERWSVFARPLDPAQDHPRRAVAARRVLRRAAVARAPRSRRRDRLPSGRQALRPARAGPA